MDKKQKRERNKKVDMVQWLPLDSYILLYLLCLLFLIVSQTM
jgi:hypothetical protein